MTKSKRNDTAKLAFKFVLTIGIVNLFADLTYEGARSITGPFLESLGASALAVGLIAGGGELFGYALRSVAGYVADKTHKYWLVVLAGGAGAGASRKLAHGSGVDDCGTNRTRDQKAGRRCNDLLRRQINRARLGVWPE